MQAGAEMHSVMKLKNMFIVLIFILDPGKKGIQSRKQKPHVGDAISKTELRNVSLFWIMSLECVEVGRGRRGRGS